MANGHLIPLSSPYNRQRARQLIDKAPADYVCEVRQRTRSKEANDKMWAMLGDISRAKPEGRRMTPDLWKAVFMQACGHEVQFLNGLDGQPFPAGFRSSRLSVAQMSELIEFIAAYGNQHGVVWSEGHD